MRELLNIVVEECDASIDEAFNEGYKSGLLEASPDVEYWRVKAEGYENKLSSMKKDRWRFVLGGFGAGLITSGALSIAVRLQE